MLPLTNGTTTRIPSMMPYKPWDVILVPFPFTDLSLNKRRPAVVGRTAGSDPKGSTAEPLEFHNIRG